jgi:3-deoxy-D-manno-octulosonate 8-phosphate phosphatase (KDO 8-P phosphatase)
MTSAFQEIPEAVRSRAQRIRLAAFDVDGSLTDGRLWFDTAGNETKAFHVLDGQGLCLLESQGIPVALITARDSAAAQARARELGLSHIFVGVKDKLACLTALCERLGIELDEVAYLGDDLPDLAVLEQVGLAAVPANAHAWVRRYAHWLTPERGGDGAARALCDLILEAQGLREAVLAHFLRQ